MNDAAVRHLRRFVEEVARAAVQEALRSQGTDRPAAPSGKAPPGVGSEWVSTREAAAIARRKPDTVRRWARAGHVEARDLGGSAGLQFRRASLLSYLSSRGLSASNKD